MRHLFLERFSFHSISHKKHEKQATGISKERAVCGCAAPRARCRGDAQTADTLILKPYVLAIYITYKP